MKKQCKQSTIESPYMTLQEATDVFRVSETSIRRGYGEFAKIKRTRINRHTFVYRESVGELRALIDKRAHTAGESLTRHRE